MEIDERLKKLNGLMKNKIPGEFIEWLFDNNFLTAPASTRFHRNYEGGLFDHSYMVAKLLVKLTETNCLSWQRPESPYIIGMFHDLCKIDQYYHPIIDEYESLGFNGVRHSICDTSKWEYNPNTLLKGHGDKSVMLLSTHMRLTEEEMLCIRFHMGAFTNKEEWSQYTDAIHKYPNVLWTHHADMLDTHVNKI